MKFTLSWLKDHLDTSATIDEISTTLSAIGLEVESVDDPSAKLAAFTVARIVAAKKHPNADKLQIVQVEIAPGKPPVEVVCGAPNARADMLGVFAPIGTYVPGLDVTLVKKPVRGVDSNGMMCSAAELDLSDESDGILDLDDRYADHVGEPYINAAGLSDPVFDVSLTPNRPDCTGVRGIARDLAAAGIGTLKPEAKLGVVDGDDKCPISITLAFDKANADACPAFAGRLIRGVRNGPSPEWMQNRLKAAGLRPINTLVDVTNYLSLDRGRPLHVYDADKLSGGIQARLGKEGENLVALDGQTYEIDDTMCVIADDSGPLGLGGVMGGAASGSIDATTNVFIESAYFDPQRTAQTGRKTGLQTDARYRFERGVDPASVMPGLDLATDMILNYCGGKPSKSMMAGKPPTERRVIAFDAGRVAELSGITLGENQIWAILVALGFDVNGKGGMAKIAVPTWRPDVHGSADLVEEVVRIAGLDKIPSTPLPRLDGVAKPVLTLAQKRSRRARRALASRGFIEAVTWSFIPQEAAAHFGGGSAELQLANPMSTELSTMRPGLLPGLLSAVSRNRNHGFADLALFELGQAYRGTAPDDQYISATGVRAGTAAVHGGGRHWQGHASDVTVFDVKADCIAVLEALGVDASKAQITRDCPAWYHPGRSGTLRLGPKIVLAHFGEIHPSTLKEMDAEAPVAGFEIFLDALPPEKRKSRAKPAMASSDLLPVTRDFAFVVANTVAAGDIVKAALAADKALITQVNVFDVFDGGALRDAGQKSVAIEVTIQPSTETLTDAAIDGIAQKVIDGVKQTTGGDIRG